MKLAGVWAASSLTRDAAGWMRSSIESKSRPFGPAITTSPSRTHRSGSADFSAGGSSGK